MKKHIDLQHQSVILSIIVSVFSILIILLLVPALMKNIYEKNLYELMDQSLYMGNLFYERPNNQFAIITKQYNGEITVDKRGLNTVDISYYELQEIINDLEPSKGTFETESGDTYYFVGDKNAFKTRFVIANSDYIDAQQNLFYFNILPVMIIFIIVLLVILYIYNNAIGKRIKKINKNIKNIDKKDFEYKDEYYLVDELTELNDKVNEVRLELQNKEKEKNELFQQISHELKTPLMIISNHFEALQDKMIEEEEAYETIENEIKNLNNQISLILQLTKYDSCNSDSKKTLLDDIFIHQIETFKKINPKITWKYENNFNDEVNKELWNMVISNIFSNFIRYTKKIINVIVDEDKIIFINDGKKIDEKLINNIFKPYVKSKDGKSGLGLYIVKKALNLNGYDIECKNIENGVEFIIRIERGEYGKDKK